MDAALQRRSESDSYTHAPLANPIQAATCLTQGAVRDRLMAGRCAWAGWACGPSATRRDVSGVAGAALRVPARLMDLWTTQARCPQPHSGHISRSGNYDLDGRDASGTGELS